MSPRRAPRPCSARPDCPNLVYGGGPCPDHALQAERRRGSAPARGYGKEWAIIRARYLRDHAPRNADGVPVCENCGTTAEASGFPLEVDHIDGSGPRGNNHPSNLQALCKPCHTLKTRAQTK